MEIRIQVNDGETFVFHQGDPIVIEAILKSVHPARFFTAPQIIIQGMGETGGFSSAFVECVEFITDREVPWMQTQSNERFATISRAEFEERCEQLRNQVVAAPPVKPSMESSGVAEFVLRSGRRAYFEYQVFARDRLEQRMLLQNFLEHPSFHALRSDGGHVLINPHNISRWVMLPGPVELPKVAWHANRTASEERPVRHTLVEEGALESAPQSGDDS